MTMTTTTMMMMMMTLMRLRIPLPVTLIMSCNAFRTIRGTIIIKLPFCVIS